eukprot:1195784-Prorocentrum_minimum.AAC.6
MTPPRAHSLHVTTHGGERCRNHSIEPERVEYGTAAIKVTSARRSRDAVLWPIGQADSRAMAHNIQV